MTTHEEYLVALMKADAAAVADKVRREESKLGPEEVLESKQTTTTKVERK
jgi:hypothetical protein